MQIAIKRWARPEVRALRAYSIPDSAGLIKLDAMENPYRWPEPLVAAWLEDLSEVAFNRYPDPYGQALCETLREKLGILGKFGILLGNGSDELIQMLALTVAQPGSHLLTVEPGFVMYRRIALITGLAYKSIPLRGEDFTLDLPAMLEALARDPPAIVFLAYPNNPTGNRFAEEDLLRIVAAAPGLVIIDEAYAPFTDVSFLPKLQDWPNVLILRTLSKLGLAGLRLGYLIGSPDWIAVINQTRLPYNINSLTQRSARFVLHHKTILDEQAKAIRSERSKLLVRMNKLAGIRAYPSEANFILFRVPPGAAEVLFAGLLERGILIKNLHKTHPLLNECLRVTVGLPTENAAFIAALEDLTTALKVAALVRKLDLDLDSNLD